MNIHTRITNALHNILDTTTFWLTPCHLDDNPWEEEPCYDEWKQFP